MSTQPKLFSARSVYFYRHKHCIIRDISLSVTPGECVILVGPNGAGKSSLLKIFSGDLIPQFGEVLLNDIPLTSWDRQQLARKRAVLPQHSELLFPLPVREIIRMGRFPYYTTTPNATDEEIVEQGMIATDTAPLAERPYNQLSGGEKQRVQFARVLVQVWPDPSTERGFLLLDEPTSNLDLAHQHRLLQMVRQFTTDGLGALVVLHDLNLAMQYADRVAVLHEGQAVTCGSPENALQPHVLRSVFRMDMHVLHSPCLTRPILAPIATKQFQASDIQLGKSKPS